MVIFKDLEIMICRELKFSKYFFERGTSDRIPTPSLITIFTRNVQNKLENTTHKNRYLCTELLIEVKKRLLVTVRNFI